MLVAQELEVGRRGVGMMLEEVGEMGPDVREKYLVDEVDRGGGAFDIEEDRANSRVRRGRAHS